MMGRQRIRNTQCEKGLLGQREYIDEDWRRGDGLRMECGCEKGFGLGTELSVMNIYQF
jgi:hypothetical protein